MFQMQGIRAEIWSQGHRVGILLNWTLKSERSGHFVLTGSGELPFLTLPESLRPPLEVHIGGSYAPVRAIGPGHFIGLAGLKEVLCQGL